MKKLELLPLTENIMYRCTDERTTDFTLALMDFIAWDDLNSKAEAGADCTSPSPVSSNREGGPVKVPRMIEAGFRDSTDDTENTRSITEERVSELADVDNRYYIWPDFILDLLTRPSEWASWRKRVERAMFNKDTQINVKRRRLNGDIYLDTVDMNNSENNVDNDLKTNENGDRNSGAVIKVIPITRRKAYFEALCVDRVK